MMSRKIFVENKRTYHGPGHYIGRPSVFGNPIRLFAEIARKEVIDLYAQYIRIRYRYERYFRDQIHNLVDAQEDIHLVCWCAPELCHGDALKQFILELRKEKGNEDTEG